MDHFAESSERKFVSRAGLKLDHALNEFDMDVTGFICADFGCNVGGFTDVLLQCGAAKVFAIDTGYGVLNYRLRMDSRVVVMERTNAIHANPPPDTAVDLVVIDLSWTPQRHAIPAAVRWVKPGGRIVALAKPHYELDEDEKKALLRGGRLDGVEAERVLRRVLEQMPSWGAKPVKWTRSPITGGKSGRASKGGGNVEFLVLAEVGSGAVCEG